MNFVKLNFDKTTEKDVEVVMGYDILDNDGYIYINVDGSTIIIKKSDIDRKFEEIK